MGSAGFFYALSLASCAGTRGLPVSAMRAPSTSNVMFCPAVQVEIFRAIKACGVTALVCSSLLQAVMFVTTAGTMPVKHEVTYLVETVDSEGTDEASGLMCGGTDTE